MVLAFLRNFTFYFYISIHSKKNGHRCLNPLILGRFGSFIKLDKLISNFLFVFSFGFYNIFSLHIRDENNHPQTIVNSAFQRFLLSIIRQNKRKWFLSHFRFCMIDTIYFNLAIFAFNQCWCFLSNSYQFV